MFDKIAWRVNSYDDYLKSVGWRLTKWLRKRDKCQHCDSRKKPLDLHHWSYDWHNRYPLARLIIPNMVDPMDTLCRKCHKAAHRYDK